MSRCAQENNSQKENILLSPNREPLIIDFGVSRADSDLVDTTHIVEVSNHNAVGTIRWLAKEFFSFFKLPPEELERQPRPQGCNKATDIWAFGMTIYVTTLLSTANEATNCV